MPGRGNKHRGKKRQGWMKDVNILSWPKALLNSLWHQMQCILTPPPWVAEMFKFQEDQVDGNWLLPKVSITFTHILSLRVMLTYFLRAQGKWRASCWSVMDESGPFGFDTVLSNLPLSLPPSFGAFSLPHSVGMGGKGASSSAFLISQMFQDLEHKTSSDCLLIDSLIHSSNKCVLSA